MINKFREIQNMQSAFFALALAKMGLGHAEPRCQHPHLFHTLLYQTVEVPPELKKKKQQCPSSLNFARIKKCQKMWSEINITD